MERLPLQINNPTPGFSPFADSVEILYIDIADPPDLRTPRFDGGRGTAAKAPAISKILEMSNNIRNFFNTLF